MRSHESASYSCDGYADSAQKKSMCILYSNRSKRSTPSEHLSKKLQFLLPASPSNFTTTISNVREGSFMHTLLLPTSTGLFDRNCMELTTTFKKSQVCCHAQL